jgi:predicted membrane-bound spermidine synthase
MPQNLTKSAYYLLFTLSGFTGLVYETVWSHYLKLILGHAAYSQALVIIIFMGGMAGGAWITSRLASGRRNLLLQYAFIELAIGLFGAVFDPVFHIIYTITFTSILPALDNPVLIQCYKILVTSLLILPQSLLLGATFPLMTEGFIRKFPKKPGQSISLLYFYNSLGAAIAALVSAFYLIGTLGMSGTIFTSGMINIFITTICMITKSMVAVCMITIGMSTICMITICMITICMITICMT